ncbi:hypothetical protein [Francisella marina]|uniref:Uncharacterized protein n=1 Tax=Francisella marina TaxID=2249302 RepID=A0ABX5ZG53_9GAMM|nr:hypothetical protein [Francisella marina]QEO57027.1 hypothetical protein F0R74_03850 [Francisella marina]QEO58857.1 hypothetical protein F0R75_03380 [Francisella marina]
MKKIFITLFLSSFFLNCFANVSKLSISTDGKYAVATDTNKHAYLYNLENKKVKDLGDNYNYSSAYFIPNSDYYSLQDNNTKVVKIFDTNQKLIKEFKPDFIARAQAINENMNLWVGSDIGGNVYQYSLPDNNKKQIFVSWLWGKMDTTPYWRGNPYKGNLPNGWTTFNSFSFYKDKLIMTAENILVVYDTKNHKWKMVNENVNETMNAIDPNGEFVYTADDRAMGVKYNLDTQKAIEFTNNTANPANYRLDYLDKSIEPIPYFIKNRKPIGKLSNFKFIDKNRIVGTLKGTTQPFLWLGLYDYNIKQKAIGKDYHFATMPLLKYIPLISTPMDYITGNYNIEPRPNVDGYNTTFDTSVEAHKLVIGQANGNGIMVYNYNPSDETLKLEWVGEPPKAEEKKEEKKEGWFW